MRRYPTLSQHALLLGRAEHAAAQQNATAELEALESAFQLDRALGGEVLARLFELALGAGNLALGEQVLEAPAEADPETPVELLSGIGDFTVNSLGGNCNNIKVPDPNHPLLRRLSADLLSHWRCSTHGTLLVAGRPSDA